ISDGLIVLDRGPARSLWNGEWPGLVALYSSYALLLRVLVIPFSAAAAEPIKRAVPKRERQTTGDTG
ncbi:hypothetical protein LZ189_16640, partial [Rhodovulum sulfidophilum]|nr:hypothetical protein [Rhodovulum sulfidophilum]